MNTNIPFQISAPITLNIFGEHAKNRLKASIDLRNTLIFEEAPASLPNDITIHFSQINLVHTISLQELLNFYNKYVNNLKLLLETVLQISSQYESINQKIFIRIFYFLIVFITYTEQIEIKSFVMILNTPSISNGEFIYSLPSLKVCLVACLFHWSRRQKGITHSTFDDTDLRKIFIYAMSCGIVAPESDFIDIMVCTYGSVITCKRGHDQAESIRLPSMTILLVDSNQTQNVEQHKIQKQRIEELKYMFPELANSILNNIDVITEEAENVFKRIFNIYNDSELSIEMKNYYLQQQYTVIEVSHNMNSIKKCCSVAHNCVFIFLHEFYLRISTSSQAEFHLTHIFHRLTLA